VAAYVHLDGPGSGDRVTAPDSGGSYEEINLYLRVDNFNLNTSSWQAVGGFQTTSTSNGFTWWTRSSAGSYAAVVQTDPGNYGPSSSSLSQTGGVSLRWLRVNIEYPPSGTGSLFVRIYESNDDTEDYSAVSWSLVEANSTSVTGLSVPVNPNGQFVLGAVPYALGSDIITCDLIRAVWEFDGVVEADFYPNGDADGPGDTSWNDPQGNTWTVTGTSVTGTPDGRGVNIGDVAFEDNPSGFTVSGIDVVFYHDINDVPAGFTVTSQSTSRDLGHQTLADGPGSFVPALLVFEWEIPQIEYSIEEVSLGSLPDRGTVMATGVRVLSSDGRALYSTFDEDDAIKLPFQLEDIDETADGFVTRSGSVSLWLDADADQAPENAPLTLDHPLRSWSGSLVEVYAGWEEEESTYSIVRRIARRATLAVGRTTWRLDGAGHQLNIDLIDMRELLDDDLDSGWTITSGDNVADALEELVRDRFDEGLDVQVTGTTWTLPTMEIDPGTSRLQVIEEIEQGSGYGVSFDVFGRCVIGPQLDVEVGYEPRYQFTTSSDRGYELAPPAANLFSDGAPSGVRLTVSSVPEDADEIEVEVWDSDPSSPTYWDPNGGGTHQPLVESVSSEAIDGEQMATMAAWAILRRSGRGGGNVIEFSSVPVPQLLAGMPILIDCPQLGVNDGWFTVESLSCPMRPGKMAVTARPSWDPSAGQGDHP